MDSDEGLDDAMCYVAETPPTPGKFLVEKALALGVPKGKSFGLVSLKLWCLGVHPQSLHSCGIALTLCVAFSI